jgi:hypothetical protein
MKLFLTLLLLNLYFVSMSQTFERKVIAAAGRETKNTLSGYTMTYTLGESIIQGKSTINVGVLSNGFIQPTTSSTTSVAYLQPNDIVIYPNPFDTRLVIDSQEDGEVKVQLVNQEGKIIVQEIIVPNNHELEIPENCAPGIYFLTIYSVSGEFLKQSRLVKLNQENNN